VLKFKSTAIMLDCGLDISTVTNFLPLPLVYSARLAHLAHWTVKDVPEASKLAEELRECEGKVFVDAEPEFSVPEIGLLDLSEVDVILISNYHCMLALPFITELTNFNGVVYATEPTLHIGRLFMEELVYYTQRLPKPNKSSFWKESNILRSLPSPLRDVVTPQTWRRCYSLQAIHSCLSKVQNVAFNETKEVYGSLQVTAISSGYCLGSCNWVLQSSHEKITYLSGSSTLTTHPKPMEQTQLKNSDVLLMTSLTQTPTANPDSMIGEFCMNTANTLKNGGNVLVPCSPSGIIYDLFECLSTHLDNCGLGSIPMYFVSPVADSSLAYSNIYAEWLSTAKQSKVYLPECPFPHAELIKCKRLQHFASIHDGLSASMRTPCVIFTGHPSLRFGDAVHFMELWGSSSTNSIIFTEPDFFFLDALAPYQPLAMKAFYCPIDTSLSFSQASKLVRELSPTHLVIPQQYTSPPTLFPNRQDLTIDCGLTPIVFQSADVINLPIRRQFERVEVAPELAKKLLPKEVQPGVGIAMVTGLLVANDNRYTLQDPASSSVATLQDANTGKAGVQPLAIGRTPARCCYGGLDILDLVGRLKQKGLTPRVETVSDGHVIVELPNGSALIRIENGSTHVICQRGNESLRVVLRDILLQCLKQLP
jgi:integrator complex subunit 9